MSNVYDFENQMVIIMGIEYNDIANAIRKCRKRFCTHNEYCYFMPSPNEGKRLFIHGAIYPNDVAEICMNILTGKKSIEDYDCVEEIDI